MEGNQPTKNRRIRDPYVDRRSGEDRRTVYDADYWENGGLERRSTTDRRQQKERRNGCVSVFEWSSVCIENNGDK